MRKIWINGKVPNKGCIVLLKLNSGKSIVGFYRGILEGEYVLEKAIGVSEKPYFVDAEAVISGEILCWRNQERVGTATITLG